ncbi:Gfo/Idh/MocA family protein [Ktedonospora formicarum]|uniref:Oxidoreductase n=1 Tax=Ktedonospora formicarum TaxID=2778364 RepID=A0A8J3HXU0_9CHLR|nr:Gfo/Idh/MocA family oxidoreductase [Ktedonospora formicarum]GHO45719.1 oxidoreductase [Ktedonospora formicarum]
METVRIGVLGAANIVPAALIKPAQQVAEVTVTAIAARDITRAQAFAKKHQIPHVFVSYEELLNDPNIDAVYIPLPNSLHGRWTIRALEAGKHVLCEKPFASNAVEAERMAQAGQQSGLILMEAFHYRYHPLAARMKEIVSSGELGTLRRIEASLCFPLFSRNDIRYNLALGGGATMDAGSYPINLLRFLSGEEPEVVQATAKLASPGVDRRMDAELRFPSGITGHIRASIFSSDLLRISARITGDQGHMSVLNYIAPQAYHRLTVKTAREHRTEHVAGDASYTYQLRAFAQAINDGTPVLTNANDAIANMQVIDAIYRKAGLQPRMSAEDSPQPTPIAN